MNKRLQSHIRCFGVGVLALLFSMPGLATIITFENAPGPFTTTYEPGDTYLEGGFVVSVRDQATTIVDAAISGFGYAAPWDVKTNNISVANETVIAFATQSGARFNAIQADVSGVTSGPLRVFLACDCYPALMEFIGIRSTGDIVTQLIQTNDREAQRETLNGFTDLQELIVRVAPTSNGRIGQLDNLVLRAQNVPAPATLALLLIGLLSMRAQHKFASVF